MRRLPYIYKLTLVEDTDSFKKGQVYIGQSCSGDKYYFTGGTVPRNIIRKYGRGIFKKETIVSGDFSREFINELEKHYIQLYASHKVGLNKHTGGGGHPVPTFKVNQFTLQGKLITSYASVQEASLFSGVKEGSIKFAAQGKYPRGGDYMWSYGEVEEMLPYVKSRKNTKPIHRYTSDRRFVESFENVLAASKAVGMSKTALYAAANPTARRKMCKGSYWSYLLFDYLPEDGHKVKITPGRKKVEMLCNGTVVRTFVSAAEMSKEMNKGYDWALYTIRRNIEFAGHTFRYAA